MNGIVSVIGTDRVGIIAAVCAKLAEHNVNILDISQTILHGSFTMVMIVDITMSDISFSVLADELNETGESMGLSIRIQRDEIFSAMNNI